MTTAPRLTETRLLVLTSDDGGAPAVDARVRLASEVIGWLRGVK